MVINLLILPKKIRLILNTTHQSREVLPSYEDWLKATGRYDDQDLAAAAIRHLGAAQEGIAAALVCDEVQDFTSLQLRAVLSLLHQTHHDLDDVQGLPLVMAGDADQQVHHSGFTWARFRGLLGQEMRSLGARPAVPGQLELRTNHRSQANIVDVAQQVQRERRERFRTAASDIVAARDAGTSVGAISMQSRGAPLASILEAAEERRAFTVLHWRRAWSIRPWSSTDSVGSWPPPPATTTTSPLSMSPPPEPPDTCFFSNRTKVGCKL